MLIVARLNVGSPREWLSSALPRPLTRDQAVELRARIPTCWDFVSLKILLWRQCVCNNFFQQLLLNILRNAPSAGRSKRTQESTYLMIRGSRRDCVYSFPSFVKEVIHFIGSHIRSLTVNDMGYSEPDGTAVAANILEFTKDNPRQMD